jgi:ribosomal-protein-alanine N-acetyltransferase
MIREFQPGDQKGIALLEEECFSSPWSETAITESRNNGTVFVVFEEKGKIIGYAGMGIVLDEGYITNIAVSKNHRNKGIGTALITELKRLAILKELRFITLEVRPSNIAALTLYKKMGFKQAGVRKNFYTSPTEDAILLTIEEF